MNFYEKELRALQKSGRFRSREVVSKNLHDFASNDYLGLAHISKFHIKACHKVEEYGIHAPKASLLVGGYHVLHKEFEEYLCSCNGFEDGVVVGSGFNANIALIEALARKGDVVLMDEKYHASGVLASQIKSVTCKTFAHNDMNELEALLQKHQDKKRRIIAVEGIYSMDGDMLSKEVFALCERYDALLIVDEAHSSGVVGENLLGVYDYYNVKITPRHIKMGTLGKAYGSFGAYILASSHIVSYLLNRAKPLIYATALSLYDTALAHVSLEYIQANKESLKEQIHNRHKSIRSILSRDVAGLIVPIVVGDNNKVMQIRKNLEKKGFAIGAIREPTVPKAILRIIARLGEDEALFRMLLQQIRQEL